MVNDISSRDLKSTVFTENESFYPKNIGAVTSEYSPCLCVARSASSSPEYKGCYITMHTVPTP